jgi:NAD(P)-dependent dehydrogenase (short-subunit alcohol dehydrogenase family)
MAGHLQDKVVAVTGAGRGIGRAVALLAAQEGARVVVADYGGRVDARADATSDVANAVVEEITAAGGEAVAAAEDVSSMAGAQRIVQMAVDVFGRLDGMACAAGIMSTKYLWELDEQEWDDVIAVHLKGHFACFQAAARVMMEQQSGHLVAISSGAAITSPPNLFAYSAAKAGVLGLVWSAAAGLSRYGINTNALMPNASTRMSDKVFTDADIMSDQQSDTISSRLAEGTYRGPEVMAPSIVYLLSDAAKDINGQVFNAKGFELQHMGPIGWDKSMTNIGPWDVATIAERVPTELGPRLQLPWVPWPERSD